MKFIIGTNKLSVYLTFPYFISLFLFLAVCNGKIRMKAQICHGIAMKGVISFDVLIKHFSHSNVKKCN